MGILYIGLILHTLWRFWGQTQKGMTAMVDMCMPFSIFSKFDFVYNI